MYFATGGTNAGGSAGRSSPSVAVGAGRTSAAILFSAHSGQHIVTSIGSFRLHIGQNAMIYSIHAG